MGEAAASPPTLASMAGATSAPHGNETKQSAVAGATRKIDGVVSQDGGCPVFMRNHQVIGSGGGDGHRTPAVYMDESIAIDTGSHGGTEAGDTPRRTAARVMTCHCQGLFRKSSWGVWPSAAKKIFETHGDWC